MAEVEDIINSAQSAGNSGSPADVWLSGNLSTLFSGKVPLLSESKVSLTKVKFEADNITRNFGEKGLAASEGLEVTVNAISAIENTGINFLLLAPQSTPFHTRIAQAQNKPEADQWTAGIVVFVQGPSPADVLTKYAALLDVIQDTSTLKASISSIASAL